MIITQEMFDTDDFATRELCIKTKNKRVKEFRAKGHKVISSILKNQQRGYSGLGSFRDCSCRDVFMISILN